MEKATSADGVGGVSRRQQGWYPQRWPTPLGFEYKVGGRMVAKGNDEGQGWKAREGEKV